MIKIPITRNLAHNAALKAEEIPANIKNSVTSGRNRFIGCLGEAALIKYLKDKGTPVTWESTGNYDLTVGELKTKVEVKTKKVESIPKPEYDCSVNCFNTTQQCDYYVFTRITNTDVYLLGYISPKDLYEIGTRMNKGDTDKNIVRGEKFQFKADCINLKISQLNKFLPQKH